MSHKFKPGDRVEHAMVEAFGTIVRNDDGSLGVVWDHHNRTIKIVPQPLRLSHVVPLKTKTVKA